MNAADRFPQQWGDGDHAEVGQHLLRTERQAVRHHEFGDRDFGKVRVSRMNPKYV